MRTYLFLALVGAALLVAQGCRRGGDGDGDADGDGDSDGDADGDADTDADADGDADGDGDADADGDVECTGGRVNCGDECVDTASDPRHCGGCGAACDPGEVCEASECAAGPDCREEPCTGLSYCDLASGQCLPGCVEDTQCGDNERCERSTHGCVCVDGAHRCSGVCSLDTSTSTCGDLCTPCPDVANGNPTCDGVACGVDCDGGYHACSGTCVSDSAVASCGTRCSPCPDDPNGSPACRAGACALDCDGGYIDCGGACIACDDPHGAPACRSGACSIDCDDGYHWDGACVLDVPCTFGGTECAAGSHCDFGLGTCMSGDAGCYQDSQCGDEEYCDVTTGECVFESATWTCTGTCYNFSGSCGSGDICVNGTCVYRSEDAPCMPGIECGGNYDCSTYDYRCHYMECGSYSGCALGMESVYGSTCSGCGSYGGGGSYYSCWPVRTYNECTGDDSCYGLRCIGGYCSMAWPCTDTSDCASAYTCGPDDVCIPYFESLCADASDCPNAWEYRCDADLGICMPAA
jgi:hypothetical protein